MSLTSYQQYGYKFPVTAQAQATTSSSHSEAKITSLICSSGECLPILVLMLGYSLNAQFGMKPLHPSAPWHKRLLMLAGSDRIFHSQINRLISAYQITSRYETERIYAPYTDTSDLSIPEGITTPVARRVINGFNNGASLINYIGHGGGGIWSDSRMLDFEDPEQNLNNISQLPLVMSMTCYNRCL